MRKSERMPFVTFFALKQSYGAEIQTFDFAKKKKDSNSNKEILKKSLNHLIN